jgi:hypothetical protein
MNPVRESTLLDFVEWLRLVKPAVRTLLSLTKDQFMANVTEYESSKGHLEIQDHNSELWRSWVSTRMFLEDQQQHSSGKNP